MYYDCISRFQRADKTGVNKVFIFFGLKILDL